MNKIVIIIVSLFILLNIGCTKKEEITKENKQEQPKEQKELVLIDKEQKPFFSLPKIENLKKNDEQTDKGNLQEWITKEAAKHNLKVMWLVKGTYLLNDEEKKMLESTPIGQLIYAITTKMTFSNSYVSVSWEVANPGIKFPHPIFVFAPICGNTIYFIELNNEQELKAMMTSGSLKSCKMLDMNEGLITKPELQNNK